VSTGKAKDRVRRCVEALEAGGLLPTFAVPGRVLERDPAFFRELAGMGAELAVHGYDHVDFRRLSPEQAARQFARALEAFRRHGIPCEGFRCPYLSYTPELAAILPEGAFTYSSNEAIAWTVVAVDPGNPVFEQLARFYRAASSQEVVSAPRARNGLVEIPTSIPDDLQLCDALGLGRDGVRAAWTDMLVEAHRRGELLAPLFHPESFSLLEGAVRDLLIAARSLQPRVWLAQLGQVARWWREKAAFTVGIVTRDDAVEVALHCSDRATVLARDWRWSRATEAWDATWSVVGERHLRIDAGARPFVGVPGAERATVDFLTEQGYIVDAGEHAARCTVVLDRQTVRRLAAPARIVAHVEDSEGPLMKISRWPREAKSALCFAGDLDALSLRDYAARLRRPRASER